VNNALVKVSIDVAQRNIEKSSTIKVMREEIKAKDAEIMCVKQENDLEQKKNQ
ncbi:hypothetical protein KI387_041322, partial [Taxus chinensis]